jgi:hypothetical protein
VRICARKLYHLGNYIHLRARRLIKVSESEMMGCGCNYMLISAVRFPGNQFDVVACFGSRFGRFSFAIFLFLHTKL